MNTAGKFIALALQAFGNKQFEDAGALFAQAAECSDVKKLTDALLQPVTSDVPDTQKPIIADNLQQLSSEDEEWGDEHDSANEKDSEEETAKDKPEDAAEKDADEGESEGEGEETDEGEATEEGDDADADESDEDEEDGEESGDELESASSGGAVHKPTRRKVTSMYQIGKILAAAMEATASEDEVVDETDEESESDSSDEDTEIMPEPDPDLPGEALVQVVLSSVTLKGLAVNSPVKLKQ